MKTYTLCFPIKRDGSGKISEVCLAMKKRDFGEGNWNGSGGKVRVDEGETIEQGLLREVEEEIGIRLTNYYKVAMTQFVMPEELGVQGVGHVFLAEGWEGEPAESEEMKPRWFKADEIPYEQMWDGDEHWLSHVFADKKVKATLEFDKDFHMLGHKVEVLADSAQLD